MTLDEAIIHAKQKAKDNKLCEECKKEHKELAYWLTKLKGYENKFYTLEIETYMYSDISFIYDSLSGYNFTTKKFVVDGEYQKAIIEIYALTERECDSLMKKFEGEMFLTVYKSGNILFEINNEY